MAIQREIEARGLPTVTVTINPDSTLQMGPPRALHPIGFRPGNVLGGANQPDLQRRVLRDALELLVLPIVPGQIVEREYPGYVPGVVPGL